MNLNLSNTKIILASQSPRRRELMEQAGLNFQIITSDVEEIISSSIPSEIVKELSSQKANDVFYKLLNSLDSKTPLLPISIDDSSILIIGADTIVANGDNIMGKPKDYNEAFKMLSSLSDSTHQVYTGVTIIVYDIKSKSTTIRSFFESTDVTFYPISSMEIDEYILSNDCYDKAGGYAIQGAFKVHIKKINGDYNNVVGLPIARLYQEIKKITKKITK